MEVVAGTSHHGQITCSLLIVITSNAAGMRILNMGDGGGEKIIYGEIIP